MKSKIFLSPPHMSGFEREYVEEAFNTNWVAPLGPLVDSFEARLGRYCHVSHVAALSSGTAAIHLALILMGVKKKDEVLVSTFTFSASVNPIVYLGAKPVFVDSEPITWNMDPELLELAIKDRIKHGSRSKLKAIIVVHLYGMPARIKEIVEIADKYDLPVIEDAAEALGSRYEGKNLGTFGKMGILSFNGNKIITTSGGGALLSEDMKLIEKARFLATQARDKAPYYQHSEIGYNYRLSNVLAGIGLGQLDVIEERIRRRREIFNNYQEAFKEIDGIEFPLEPDSKYYSNRWLTTVLLNPEKISTTWYELYLALEKENIEARPLWKPMHQQPVFASFPTFLNGTSDSLFSKGICLPSGSGMSNADQKRVQQAVLKNIKFR